MRPAHVHFKVTAPGYQALITHVFDESDQYLDTDAVFGVRSSLLATFEHHDPGTCGQARTRRRQTDAGRPADDDDGAAVEGTGRRGWFGWEQGGPSSGRVIISKSVAMPTDMRIIASDAPPAFAARAGRPREARRPPG